MTFRSGFQGSDSWQKLMVDTISDVATDLIQPLGDAVFHEKDEHKKVSWVIIKHPRLEAERVRSPTAGRFIDSVLSGNVTNDSSKKLLAL